MQPAKPALLIDLTRCIGCEACVWACKESNGLPREEGVGKLSAATWSALERHGDVAVRRQCMHCLEPACASVCPVGALYKTAEGPVVYDADKCIGCRYCEWACPYGAPQFDAEAGVMTKCTFCEDLLAQGQAPACVDACVMRALEFGELDQLRAKYGTVNAFEPLPPGEITEPALVLTPHRHAQAVGMGTGQVLGLPEEA
jgi:anaerobic dimethyl sulfoxide reductase subunit B (iron-sulfur subunit)